MSNKSSLRSNEADIKKKRIAFVSDAIYPYNKGGKETRLFQISTRLAKLGYDVHVYTMQWWEGEKNRDEHGVHLHAICPLYPLYDGERRSIKEGVLFGLACFRLLGEDFDMVDVDHMPFFPLYSMRIVCWLKGKKLTATWHEVWGRTYWKEYLPGLKGEIASMIESMSFSLPDRIISVSDMTAKRLKEYGASCEIVTVQNGVDSEAIEKVPPSKMHSDVIFAGRLLKHKHIDLLLDAIHQVKERKPDISCIIVGEGPELESLRKQSKRLDLEQNVTFLPFSKDVQDTYALMKSSKVFVLPSTREGFGLVVLEANACGIPVITVNHPDNAAKELIHEEENGFVIQKNLTALSNKIYKLLSLKAEDIEKDKNLRVWDWNNRLFTYLDSGFLN